MAAAGQKTYLYEFTHVPPHPNSKLLGAFHTSEIPYVFNDLRQPRAREWTITDIDLRLADVMSTYWVNFVTHGDPNGEGLPHWAPYDTTNEAYMDLGDTPVVRHHLLKQQLDAIEGFQQRQSTSR